MFEENKENQKGVTLLSMDKEGLLITAHFHYYNLIVVCVLWIQIPALKSSLFTDSLCTISRTISVVQ